MAKEVQDENKSERSVIDGGVVACEKGWHGTWKQKKKSIPSMYGIFTYIWLVFVVNVWWMVQMLFLFNWLIHCRFGIPPKKWWV